jgi:hypothetical protein
MEPSMRPRPVLAVLAAILAGLTLAAAAVAVDHEGQATHAIPGSGCPPAC